MIYEIRYSQSFNDNCFNVFTSSYSFMQTHTQTLLQTSTLDMCWNNVTRYFIVLCENHFNLLRVQTHTLFFLNRLILSTNGTQR